MGSERVKGYATNNNWIGVAHPRRFPSRIIFRNFSVKVVARILRRILVTMTKISMRVQQCVRFARYARSQLYPKTDFLSERFFLVHAATAALLDFEHARVWST